MPHINHRRGETRKSVNREVRCSCPMCCNPRHSDLYGEHRTRAERLFDQSADEAIAEYFDELDGEEEVAMEGIEPSTGAV